MKTVPSLINYMEYANSESTFVLCLAYLEAGLSPEAAWRAALADYVCSFCQEEPEPSFHFHSDAMASRTESLHLFDDAAIDSNQELYFTERYRPMTFVGYRDRQIVG